MPQIFVKTPGASSIDYTINWDDGYLTTGEELSTSSWVTSPSSTSFAISNSAFTTATATIDLAGGIHGETYYIQNTVVTSGGRTDTRTLQIEVWGPR